jgi:hypothetical protein
MRRALTVVLAILVLALGAWWLARGPEPSSSPEPGPTAAAPAVEEAARSGFIAPSGPPAWDGVERVAHKTVVDAAERERVLQGIRDALDRRARADAEPRDEAGPSPDPAPPDPTGGIRDRSGGELAAFVGTIDDDFMPLADECYEQARETAPDLRGMLDLHLAIIADEEIGGLVESIELGHENEIAHPGFTECIRETMLSTIFPPPDGSGRAAMRLTMRFSPEAE